jgi:D-alanyl-D-alanine carboxypeptidase (penicillin-binding protein 5/6)
MNNKVKELGLMNTNFITPYGFDDENHYSSCYDMAIMASYLINNYPNILNYTSIYEDYVREDTEKKFWLVNTNKLVKFIDGVDGLKTGWTNNSGYCLTATISKNNERFIVVNMGNSSPSIRNKEVSELLQYAIKNYETIKLVSKNDIIDEINDISKKPNKITFKANEDVIIVKNKNEKIKDFKIEKYIDIKNNNFYIDVYYDNLLHKRIRLTTDNDIKKANIFNIFYEILRKIFSN